MAFTEGLEKKERYKVLRDSVLTALLVGYIFVFTGRYILDVMGIEVADFQIAGGLLLVILSIADLLAPEKKRRRPSGDLGVVPLGIPLIAGPAVITTLLVLRDAQGIPVVSVTFLVNMLLLFGFLVVSERVKKIIGTAGCSVISKIIVLLLAAFGVMFIRKGLFSII